METLKTIFHAYSFDTRDPDDAKAYAELRAKLKAAGADRMHGWPYTHRPELDGKEITLELTHLFNNQWNTAPIPGVSDLGLRVFDWHSDATPGMSKDYKRGEYLDITDAMREARRNTVACGYCGKQEAAARGSVFCAQCLDSAYLKEEDLNLLRMRPIDAPWRENRAPLTDAERAHLLPLFLKAQIHGNTERGRARIAKQRADIARTYAEKTANAKTEHDGYLWLLDHGINTENVLFYTHTGRFGFGWRKPMSDAEVSRLLDAISEFRWPYDIETAPGGQHGRRKLSGEG